MITIYRWPDGTWCDYENIESYVQWMGEDYEIAFITEDEYEQLIK